MQLLQLIAFLVGWPSRAQGVSSFQWLRKQRLIDRWEVDKLSSPLVVMGSTRPVACCTKRDGLPVLEETGYARRTLYGNSQTLGFDSRHVHLEIVMQSKNPHSSEHRSHPASKMIPKGALASEQDINGNVMKYSAGTRKVIKKQHTRRSRQYLKRTISDESRR